MSSARPRKPLSALRPGQTFATLPQFALALGAAFAVNYIVLRLACAFRVLDRATLALASAAGARSRQGATRAVEAASTPQPSVTSWLAARLALSPSASAAGSVQRVPVLVTLALAVLTVFTFVAAQTYAVATRGIVDNREARGSAHLHCGC